MSAAAGLLRRSLTRLRRSMTAQISLSITAVSILIIAVYVAVTGQFVRAELREENELTLLANLAFFRDDIAAAGGDLAQAPRLLERAERRVHRLHIALLDAETHGVIASSPGSAVPPSTFLESPALDARLLPPQASVADVDRVREQFADATTTWRSPAGAGYRLLTGRIDLPAAGVRPARSVLVALAVDTLNTSEVRWRDRRDLLIGMAIAAALASAMGLWIARRIVVSARRLGAAASRIGARALDERLPLDDSPVELVESTIAFNHMLDRLQNAFERLSAFSSDLAHDLRTPMGNLLGEAQVALSRPRSAVEYRAVLESAVEEYERLSRMIGNMLFLASADNEQAALSAGWIDLAPALDRVIGYFEVLAEERAVVLERSLRPTPGAAARVWADETMLIRALSNLVSNALRHAASGSRVEIAAHVDPAGGCTIEVSNTGAPIPPEQQARIFQRFYRGDASRHGSSSGSGLGLAIVRSIMELHGGTAAVFSTPGHRTVFVLRFPPQPVAASTGYPSRGSSRQS
jgi:two-component system heavy metal sensor histidine kinase CusS